MKKIRRKHLVEQPKQSSEEENNWKDKVKTYMDKRNAFLEEEKKKWKKRNTLLKQQKSLPDESANVPYTGKHISDTLFRLRAYSVKVANEILRREEEFQRMKQHYKYCAALPPEVESDMSFCYAKLPAYVLTIKQLKSMKISGRKMAMQAGKEFTFDDEINKQVEKFEALLVAVKNFLLEINSFFSIGNISDIVLAEEIECFISSCVTDRSEPILKDVNVERRLRGQNGCSSNTVLNGTSEKKPNCVQTECGRPVRSERATGNKDATCNGGARSSSNATAQHDKLENKITCEQPDIRNRHVIPECTICQICFTKRKNFLRHMVSMHNYKC